MNTTVQSKHLQSRGITLNSTRFKLTSYHTWVFNQLSKAKSAQEDEVTEVWIAALSGLRKENQWLLAQWKEEITYTSNRPDIIAHLSANYKVVLPIPACSTQKNPKRTLALKSPSTDAAEHPQPSNKTLPQSWPLLKTHHPPKEALVLCTSVLSLFELTQACLTLEISQKRTIEESLITRFDIVKTDLANMYKNEEASHTKSRQNLTARKLEELKHLDYALVATQVFNSSDSIVTPSRRKMPTGKIGGKTDPPLENFWIPNPEQCAFAQLILDKLLAEDPALTSKCLSETEHNTGVSVIDSKTIWQSSLYKVYFKDWEEYQDEKLLWQGKREQMAKSAVLSRSADCSSCPPLAPVLTTSQGEGSLAPHNGGITCEFNKHLHTMQHVDLEALQDSSLVNAASEENIGTGYHPLGGLDPINTSPMVNDSMGYSKVRYEPDLRPHTDNLSSIRERLTGLLTLQEKAAQGCFSDVTVQVVRGKREHSTTYSFSSIKEMKQKIKSSSKAVATQLEDVLAERQEQKMQTDKVCHEGIGSLIECLEERLKEVTKLRQGQSMAAMTWLNAMEYRIRADGKTLQLLTEEAEGKSKDWQQGVKTPGKSAHGKVLRREAKELLEKSRSWHQRTRYDSSAPQDEQFPNEVFAEATTITQFKDRLSMEKVYAMEQEFSCDHDEWYDRETKKLSLEDRENPDVPAGGIWEKPGTASRREMYLRDTMYLPMRSFRYEGDTVAE